MSKSIKYGIYYYDTENIGDEIQSVAAKRFLPRIDYYINRDDIDATNFKPNEKIKLIMNGWYLEKSKKDNEIHWPPTNQNIDPLLISMHISFLNGSIETFKTLPSRTFLKKYAPVGARDYATKKYLESIGVPSYFSGCLTLTLLPDEKIKKSDFILAVDVDSKVLQAIQKRSSRPIVSINTVHNGNYTIEERFDLATYWLYLYQSAHCIITPRLHAMLPGLAFDTPVIALTGRDAERYSGLIELVNHYTPSDFIKNKKISVDKPAKNPTSFQSIRDNLVKICSSYTNFDSKSSFMDGLSIQELFNKPSFINAITKTFEDSYDKKQLYLRQEKEVLQLKDDINKLNLIISEKDNQIHDLANPGIKSSLKLLKKSIKNYSLKIRNNH